MTKASVIRLNSEGPEGVGLQFWGFRDQNGVAHRHLPCQPTLDVSLTASSGPDHDTPCDQSAGAIGHIVKLRAGSMNDRARGFGTVNEVDAIMVASLDS